MKSPASYLAKIKVWAKQNHNVLALALVGSHARHMARPDSDIDFVIISADKAKFLNDFSWLETFGAVEKSSVEEWGIVSSIRVFYQDGQEIEFGIAPEKWAALPVDSGTRRVISGGFIIYKDKDNLLSDMVRALQ